MSALSDFLLGDAIIGLEDTDGRAVSEPTSQGQTYSSCPYSDRRKSYPMNRPALEQVAQHWQSILDWICSSPRHTTSLRQTLDVALLASVEPALYCLANSRSPIPAEMSARYKACLGFCQVLFFMVLNDPDPDNAKLSDYGSKDEFFQWLDSEGWLLGQHQACAGPRSMIEQLFERFCYAELPARYRATIEDITVLVALQSIHTLSNHKQEGSAAARLFRRSQSPWLFTLVQDPDRDPKDVCKLFAQGATPLKVETLLANPADEVLFLALHK